MNLRDNVREFFRNVRAMSGKNVVCFTLTITPHDYEVSISERDGFELERTGSAMRNLRGEWITAATSLAD